MLVAIDIEAGATGTEQPALRTTEADFKGVVIEQVDAAVFVAVRRFDRKPEAAVQFEAPADHRSCVGLADGAGKLESATGAAHHTTAVDRRPNDLKLLSDSRCDQSEPSYGHKVLSHAHRIHLPFPRTIAAAIVPKRLGLLQGTIIPLKEPASDDPYGGATTADEAEFVGVANTFIGLVRRIGPGVE